MGYSAKAVANYFLALAKEEDKDLTPLQIQKLVYLAHGWYMAFYEEPLVDDEYVEAWDYGPVFPSLYHELKEFGADPINRLAKNIEYIEGADKLGVWIPVIGKEDSITKNLLGQAWEVYKDSTGGQLIELTHTEGSPWAQTRSKHKNIINADISNDIIREYYKGKLKEHRERNGE